MSETGKDTRPVISISVDNVHCILAALSDSTEELYRRLEPVMSNVEPAMDEVPSNQQETEGISRVPLADCLNNICDKITAINNNIVDMLYKLGV